MIGDSAGDGPRSTTSGSHETRFTRLLTALILLLMTAPVVGAFEHQLGRALASVLVVIALSAVLIAAALAVSERDRQSHVAIGLVVACIGLSVVAHFSASTIPRTLQNVLTIALLLHVVRLIIRSLFLQRQVDFDTIAASLCGYLLIGVGFAAVFSLVIELDREAIDLGPVTAESALQTMRFGDHTTATALYFSFVTLTTLGYGDITPVSMPARLLTTAEALIGQLYLVVLVARLVGLHIAGEMSDDRKP